MIRYPGFCNFGSIQAFFVHQFDLSGTGQREE